jgi:hypothetical protein
MTLDSPLTIFALVIPPIVTLIFASLLWFKRDPISSPSIVAAIPLALSSIAILLAQSAVVLLRTFNEIATHKAAGLGAVVSGLLVAQRPLIWGFVDFGTCLIVIFLVSAFFSYLRDAETPLIHAYISLPALIGTAVVVIAVFLIVYVQYITVDLVMMIVDKHRYRELVSRFGMVNPAYFASTISSRLVAITLLSTFLFCALIVAGVLSLVWRQKQNSRQAFAVVLTLGAIIGCACSSLSELGFVDYLRHMH